jgi:hypothetical protein
MKGCRSRLSGHVCHRKVQKKTWEGWKVLGMKPSTGVFIGSPSKEWDPSQYYLSKLKDYQADHMALLISWLQTSNITTSTSQKSSHHQQSLNQTARTMAMGSSLPGAK